MGNRKLYREKSFVVESVHEIDYENSRFVIHEKDKAFHLVGYFTPGSIKSKYNPEYRIRVTPDERWRSVKKIAFKTDIIYECESVERVTRKHIYGSGRWYISPPRSEVIGSSRFDFEGFDVLQEDGK